MERVVNLRTTIVGVKADAPVLRKHSLLKQDCGQISHRAESLSTGKVSVDGVSKVGGLAKRLGAEFDIVVNFDSGSGFLTGIALRGNLFSPYGMKFPAANGKEPTSIKSLGEEAFVINKDTNAAEWAAVLSFIERLASSIEQAEKNFTANKFGTLHTQICFWEVRQYEELCNAFGRHLLNILDLNERYQRALAWIFPPEELLEKSDHKVTRPSAQKSKEILLLLHALAPGAAPVRIRESRVGLSQHTIRDQSCLDVLDELPQKMFRWKSIFRSCAKACLLSTSCSNHPHNREV
jgi:hypothetical protein